MYVTVALRFLLGEFGVHVTSLRPMRIHVLKITMAVSALESHTKLSPLEKDVFAFPLSSLFNPKKLAMDSKIRS
jgi:hypothetical protein